MGLFSIKLPDVGEGIAEVELVEWSVKVGDIVREDDVLAAVMTDKATVDIPAVVAGKVVWLCAEVGEMIAVGSDLIRFEVDGEGNLDADSRGRAPSESAAPEDVEMATTAAEAGGAETKRPGDVMESELAAAPPFDKTDAPPQFKVSGLERRERENPLASPSVRRRALDAGIDLRQVHGSGPDGRIVHDDLNTWLGLGAAPSSGSGFVADTSVDEIEVVGLRRKVAEKMILSKSRIPHITIVEEVDVTQFEQLRERLNSEKNEAKAKLTILPFLMRSIVKAVGGQPSLNAHYDDEAGILRQYGGVHIGIAVQTPNGLVVPVVHHAEALDIWASAKEVLRLSEAARDGAAKREELIGSTITITSLGALGGLATTPIINHPEVAIVGVNKISVRPVWSENQFVPRRMMNLSCSFDHRIIDGWEAASFIQRLKTLIETPATIF